MPQNQLAQLNSNRTSSRRRINWRQEYLHVTVMVITICWLAPWVALSLSLLLNITLAAALKLTTVHLVSSLLLVRWMHYRRVNANLQAVTVLLLMWVAAAITIAALPSLVKVYGGEDRIALADLFHIDRKLRVPAGPLVVIWVLLLWWRGYNLGSAYMTLVRASFGMRLGILSFLWVSVFAGQALREDMLALVPFFFFFGLLGTSLARADSLSLDRTNRRTTFGRGWMLSLVAIALTITLGGYTAALWMSGMNLEQIARVFTKIAEVVLTMLFAILTPILILAQAIYDFLHSLFPENGTGFLLDIDTSEGEPGGVHGVPWLNNLLAFLSDALAVVIVVFIVLLVIAFVWFLFIAQTHRQTTHDEEREALGTAEVVGGLRRTLHNTWRRLTDALGIFRQFGLGRDLFAALTIRRIYARMEKLAGKRGYPRALSETPYEYRRELHQAYPGHGDDIRTITEAYVAVRYGDVPETSDELQNVRAAWERLQASEEPI